MFTKANPAGMRASLTLATTLCAFAYTGTAAAGDISHGDAEVSQHQNHSMHKAHRADGHAPIGVMGDHRHHEGGLMLSYRYMRMWMEGNLIGDNEVTPENHRHDNTEPASSERRANRRRCA